jgi:simple sugar transport system permease protein
VTRLALFQIPLPGGTFLSIGAVSSLAVLAVAVYSLHHTRFGRHVYALGGSEQSALLMGLPVRRTKIAVYTVSGLCSAFAGLLFTLYIQSGDPLHALGLELDAIAAVVIGGTLLTGGSGYVIGTLFGVLVLGLIKTLISFEGTLSSWWTKIATGVLLLAFILLQRVLGRRR